MAEVDRSQWESLGVMEDGAKQQQRVFVVVGAVGSRWESLGAIGSHWESLGAVGVNYVSLPNQSTWFRQAERFVDRKLLTTGIQVHGQCSKTKNVIETGAW